MNSILLWLSHRKELNIGLILLYFIVVVLPHKKFGTWINQTFLGEQGFTRDQYNQGVAIVATIILVLGCISIHSALKKNKNNKKIILYLLSSIGFAILIIKYLFVINIEMVHFPQYAFFTILVFPLVKRYQSALIWTTIAGSIDEAYQYFYLAPNETGYYDFNDVWTNLIGATFGLIILKSFDIKNKIAPQFFRRSEIIALGVIFILIGLLFFLNILGIHTTGGAAFPIVKKVLTSFWTTIPPNVTFHVVRPLEGTIGTLVLWLFYWKLGRE